MLDPLLALQTVKVQSLSHITRPPRCPLTRYQTSWKKSSPVAYLWFSVESTNEMMVIRLEAVDEDNYGSIISVLKELGKRWELTNINGERILKILL